MGLGADLQGHSQADQVHHDVLVGQLDGEDGQRGEEQLEVLVDVVFLLTAQVDVAVQLLPVLQRWSEEVRGGQRNIRGHQRSENIREGQRNIRGTSEKIRGTSEKVRGTSEVREGQRNIREHQRNIREHQRRSENIREHQGRISFKLEPSS